MNDRQKSISTQIERSKIQRTIRNMVLASETKVPTPTGWATVGNLGADDELFDDEGNIVTVDYIYNYDSPEMFDVYFDDGQKVVAGATQQWRMTDPSGEDQIITTEDMFVRNGGRGFKLMESPTLKLAAKNDSFPLYSLGACMHGKKGEDVTVRSLVELMWASDGLFVLSDVLRGSHEERLAFLRGVMDYGGEVNEHRQCSFSHLGRRYVGGILELVRSLGILAEIVSLGRGWWEIRFQTDLPIFTIPEKLMWLRHFVSDAERKNYVTDIVPAGSRPGVGVQTRAYNASFLIEGMLPVVGYHGGTAYGYRSNNIYIVE